MKTFKNKYIDIRLEENALLWDKWSKDSEIMSEADFKETIQVWRDILIENQVKTVLIDTTDFAFTIVPELQIWLDKNITEPTFRAGLEKMAFLVSNDLFSQVSIEQTMNESDGPLMLRYFEDEQEARLWLKE